MELVSLSKLAVSLKQKEAQDRVRSAYEGYSKSVTSNYSGRYGKKVELDEDGHIIGSSIPTP
jgi:Zn-dependent membrane protease YugP